MALDKLTPIGFSVLWVVNGGSASEVVFDPRSLRYAAVPHGRATRWLRCLNARDTARSGSTASPGTGSGDVVMMNVAAALVTWSWGRWDGLCFAKLAETVWKAVSAGSWEQGPNRGHEGRPWGASPSLALQVIARAIDRGASR